MERTERLAALELFFECSAAEAELLNDAMSLAVYSHKSVLMHQGDPCTKAWIVLDGLAQMQVIGSDGQTQLLAAHGPGELFGALLSDSIMVSDIIAQNQLKVLEASTVKLRLLVDEQVRISSGLARILARQYNAILDRMAARVTLTAIGRVYAELLSEADNGNTISPPPVVSALGLKAQTTRETASRAINALVRRGIVSRDSEKLVINSRSLLEDLVV
ncbi:MAG: Crp/Fnr family transcriptional regulator [Rhodocyclaceae bacterium]|nr:Crp/Fnr family transcriptional regulator [Rhodocyclaceae bacterium]